MNLFSSGTRARGTPTSKRRRITRFLPRSGPLFHFDVREDIRAGGGDVRAERDESHPGKVVMRSWYERNKHIFPASRWEAFDPAAPAREARYAVKGD